MTNDAAVADGTAWGLHNTGQNGGVPGADVDALLAWDVATDAGNVVVGVIDTGLRFTHEELANNLWTNPGEIPGNGIDDDNNGWVDDVHGIDAVNMDGDPTDDESHGTWCSGIIAGEANNNVGRAGVTWNTQLMALKFLASDGFGSTDDAIVCIDYALAMGVDVTSNSWGGGPFSQAEYDAIAAHNAAGIPFVTAAGSGARSTDDAPAYPASYDLPNIVSVAATDRLDDMGYLSNFGVVTVDIGAPGIEIHSASNLADDDYDTGDGTSAAAPFVTGTLALLMQLHPGEGMNALLNRLYAGSDSTPAMAGVTSSGKRLNVHGVVTTASPAPQNDDFANATTIVNGSGRLSGRMFHATTETGEPVHAGVGSGTSLWWRFDVPQAGDYLITTAESDIDTVLAVYEGVSVDALTLLASNVDAANSPNGHAAIEWAASSATSLFIAVDSQDGSEGIVRLRVSGPPPSDAFAQPLPMAGLLDARAINTLDFTKEPGEPDHAGNVGGASAWLSWTAPSDGDFVIRAVSNIDTLLAIYTGSDLASLTPIVSNDDAAGGSEVTLAAVAGTTYRIAVDGKNTGSGAAVGNVDVIVSPPPPPNDNFADALPIDTVPATVVGNNIGATLEPGEPIPFFGDGASIWWTFTAPTSGSVEVSLAGSSIDCVVAIYVGDSVNSLIELAWGELFFGNLVPARFSATAGQTYRVAVHGQFEAGDIRLSFQPPPPPPANDNFADAIELSAGSLSDSGTNIGATTEPNEPLLMFHASESVWWMWTAPSSGVARVDTFGSDFDTVLGVYRGASLASLQTLGDIASSHSSIVWDRP